MRAAPRARRARGPSAWLAAAAAAARGTSAWLATAAAVAATASLAGAQPLPTLAPGVARFSADSVLVTRGGAPGGGTVASVAYGVSVVEYTTAGQALQTLALSTNTSRCGAPWTINYATDHFAQVRAAT